MHPQSQGRYSTFPGQVFMYGFRTTMIHDGLWDVYNDIHMGNTGETVAQESDISRLESDEFAVRSHLRAAQAWEKSDSVFVFINPL